MGWKNKFKNSICTVKQLKKYLVLNPEEETQLEEIIKIHPMRIPKYYMSLIDKNNSNDPIRKMIVPSEKEFDLTGSYDTSGEKENTKTIGLQHKYQETALILSTNRCAAYCRHCFRKRLVGLSNEEVLHRFNESINYIKNHKEINNVLISGGDPFILPTKTIEKFLKQLSKIPHLDFIRFGTRTPVTFPHRITEDKSLLKVLKKYSKKNKRIYIVTHFNHPREITKESIDAINKLINSNIIINNQTVLLKDVNDNPEILVELLNKLVSIGVNPYYVFQCRPVKRVKQNFELSIFEGIKIVDEARKQLNGHAKRFKYMMSHVTGKIEILGILNNEIYFKQHQAKDPEKIGKIFKRKMNKTAGWLDDFEEKIL